MPPDNSQESRVYAAAHFALELDGQDVVGLFRTVEGGGTRAEVMTYQNGTSYDRWRQLGKPRFEDIKVQVGMAMSKPFYEWIKGFFNGEAIRKTGSIVAADFTYLERARRDFTDAMIHELTFPKLEGGDTNAVYMAIALAVEDLVYKKPDAGKMLNVPVGFDEQKMWTACKFNFTLDGFDAACARVSKIDSFTVKQNILEYHQGGRRSPSKTPSQIDFPNIVFYLPEPDAGPFFDHFTKRASKGEVRPAETLNGAIETTDQEGNDLFTLSFRGADICNIQVDKSDAATDEIKQVRIELYTESMEFKYHPMETFF